MGIYSVWASFPSAPPTTWSSLKCMSLLGSNGALKQLSHMATHANHVSNSAMEWRSTVLSSTYLYVILVVTLAISLLLVLCVV